MATKACCLYKAHVRHL
uniref:Uncharacterized protein n=1 Tax=Arundo donax TaxID=35708 RepID=A0A0A9F4B0_ARUDO